MELILEKIITASGIELTVDEARQYITRQKIVLPEELARELINRHIEEQLKSPVPSNRA